MKTREEIEREIAEQDRKEAELLATLEIPEYTDRRLKADTVKRKEENGEHRSIEGASGWGAGCSKEVFEALEVGDPFILETKGFNTISGWIVKGKWFNRKSDQDLVRDFENWKAEHARKQAEFVAEHRADWEKREAALPEWAKAIIEKNRAEDPKFDSMGMGWGYTLIALELAVIYAKDEAVKDLESMHGYQESEEAKAFHSANGTSGNQAGWGFAVARAHLRGEL